MQRGSEAARQRGSEAARQRGSEAARLVGWLVGWLVCWLPVRSKSPTPHQLTNKRPGNFSALPSDGSSSSDDPMAPSKLDVEMTTSTSTVITWEDASASPPDQSYTVNCVPGSDDTDCLDKGGVRLKNIKAGVEKATVNGLSPGSEYSCWVQLNSVILSDHCSKEPVIITTS